MTENEHIPARNRSLRSKTGDNGFGNRLRPDLRRIGSIARRPDACFAALDRESVVHNQPMLDFETRGSEFDYLRRQFHNISEAGWREKSGAGVNNGDAENAVGGGKVRRRNA
jgi:hypothetical protein